MSTSNVLKDLKIARAVSECNLRTFKTSRVIINHEMHEQLHTIFYLLYIEQNYSVVDSSSSCSCSNSSVFVFTFTLNWKRISKKQCWEFLVALGYTLNRSGDKRPVNARFICCFLRNRTSPSERLGHVFGDRGSFQFKSNLGATRFFSLAKMFSHVYGLKNLR